MSMLAVQGILSPSAHTFSFHNWHQKQDGHQVKKPKRKTSEGSLSKAGLSIGKIGKNKKQSGYSAQSGYSSEAPTVYSSEAPNFYSSEAPNFYSSEVEPLGPPCYQSENSALYKPCYQSENSAPSKKSMRSSGSLPSFHSHKYVGCKSDEWAKNVLTMQKSSPFLAPLELHRDRQASLQPHKHKALPSPKLDHVRPAMEQDLRPVTPPISRSGKHRRTSLSMTRSSSKTFSGHPGDAFSGFRFENNIGSIAPMTPLAPPTAASFPKSLPLPDLSSCKLAKKKAPSSLGIMAHRWSIDLETLQQAATHFKKHVLMPKKHQDEDVLNDGFLTEDAMLEVVCELCNVESVDDMTSDVKRIMIVADTNGDGMVSFEEFAQWYNNRAFVEFFNCDKSELDVRELGHKLGITPSTMEAYKVLYDKYDENGEGDLDYEAFGALMHDCMRCPKTMRIPDSRIAHQWRECDVDGSGGIDLEEFVTFYRKHFDTDANDAGSIDQYYKGIRRCSVSM